MSARAEPVSPMQHPEVYTRLNPLVGDLSRRMGISMPRLWVTPDLSTNAFATGRNPHHALVAMAAGILQLMNDRELSAVLAHELGHVKNRDILTSSIAAKLGAAMNGLSGLPASKYRLTGPLLREGGLKQSAPYRSGENVHPPGESGDRNRYGPDSTAAVRTGTSGCAADEPASL